MSQMQIQRVFLNNVEVSRERAQELYEKYITSYMVNECFYGGLAITTPEGELRAEVKLIN